MIRENEIDFSAVSPFFLCDLKILEPTRKIVKEQKESKKRKELWLKRGGICVRK